MRLLRRMRPDGWFPENTWLTPGASPGSMRSALGNQRAAMAGSTGRVNHWSSPLAPKRAATPRAIASLVRVAPLTTRGDPKSPRAASGLPFHWLQNPVSARIFSTWPMVSSLRIKRTPRVFPLVSSTTSSSDGPL